MNALAYWLIFAGVFCTVGYVVGFMVGHTAHQRRADRDRQQVTSQLLAVAGSRARHPSARPLTGQAAIDEWLRQNPPGGAA